MSNIKSAQALIATFATGDLDQARHLLSDTYTQHNLDYPTGPAGFIAAVTNLQQAPVKTTVENIRAFEDHDFVVLHNRYNFAGAGEQAAFDIFRFDDDGKITEHWDNLAPVTDPNPSGHTQFDGTTIITDLNKTDANKQLVHQFIRDVLQGKNPSTITDYFDGDHYIQHNSQIADGLSGLNAAMAAMAKANQAMVYTKNHLLLGQGNFVLAVSEGEYAGEHVAFYDLFRIDQAKLAEHWDIVAPIPAPDQWKNNNGKF